MTHMIHSSPYKADLELMHEDICGHLLEHFMDRVTGEAYRLAALELHMEQDELARKADHQARNGLDRATDFDYTTTISRYQVQLIRSATLKALLHMEGDLYD